MGKKENRKIQDFDGLYAFLRHYVDFMLRMAYRRIKYVGLEKYPPTGLSSTPRTTQTPLWTRWSFWPWTANRRYS